MTVFVRMYATGHCDPSADAPEELAEKVKHALARSTRVECYLDKGVMLEVLTKSGVSPDEARAICATARMCEDETYASREWAR